MKINLALIALGAAVLSTPAAAQSSEAPQKRSGEVREAAQEKKYCLQYDKLTGSRVNTQACKTKSEWAKEDVDIDEVLKSK